MRYNPRTLPAACLFLMSVLPQLLAAQQDPYLWLEKVLGGAALEWVQQQNERSLPQIRSYPAFQEIYEDSLEILNSDERIPEVSRRGDFYYNFWQDADHVRGIYRRTTLDGYRQADPPWEVILDIDALAEAEGKNWVFDNMFCLYPEFVHCMVRLSIGGADAVVQREFDMSTREFVEDGFFLPEAKSRTSWIDQDTLFVGTDFGPGSLTESGYPRIVRIWRRGQPLEEADVVYTGAPDSVQAGARIIRDGDTAHAIVVEAPSFFRTRYHAYDDGEITRLPIPDDALLLNVFNDQLFIELKSAWNGFNQGAVIHAPYADVVAGSTNFRLFVEPGPRSSIDSVGFTRETVLVNWRDNVKSRLEQYRYVENRWQASPVQFPVNGTLRVTGTDPSSDDFLVNYRGFLEPPTLYHIDGQDLSRERLKGLPAMFDASGFVVEQFEAESVDGTRIPYFLVRDRDIRLDGSNPTLMYGYGGFEITYGPRYSAAIGRNWLERGGVYVLANIRGGGEFGPAWHQAALLKNRHKAFEDFESVAEDLIQRGITSPRHLGIQGGSNGGLLVGSVVMRRPELFNAVVCQVPLLDMRRYNKLLAGASWMGEYGNPDIAEDWEYLRTYSPYHNVRADAEYPRIFFTTSTRDDRVHPGHARKMVARMSAMGHDVLYFENTEGGHAGAANNEQRALVNSLVYAYLWQQLE